MRHLLFLTLTISLLFIFGCKKEENIQSATVSVKSMGCDNCAYLVRKAIFTLNGVKDVEADLEKKLVTVKYLPEYTNLESIEIAITRAGYDANDRPRDSLAVKELPECCQNHN
jgi:copper chaperone CopZ